LVQKLSFGVVVCGTVAKRYEGVALPPTDWIMMSVRRYLAAVAGAAVVAIAFTVPSASASTDSTTAEGYQYENAGRCLDGSLSGGLALKTCNAASSYQRWTLGSDSLLRNAHYGAVCVDGSISQGVRLEYCDTASVYQKWTRSGTEFRNNANPGYCLDYSVSQGFRLAPCNGTTYQRWGKLQDV
jgi:hypothetical protein